MNGVDFNDLEFLKELFYTAALLASSSFRIQTPQNSSRYTCFQCGKKRKPTDGFGSDLATDRGTSNILAKLESRLKFCCKIISQKYKKVLAIKRMEQREKYFYYAAFASSITDKADFS